MKKYNIYAQVIKSSLFVSINAGRLLPFQDYMLYKPSGSIATRTYFQQKSDTDAADVSVSMATLDDEECVNSSDVTVPVTSVDVIENNDEFGEQFTLQSADSQHRCDQSTSSHSVSPLCPAVSVTAVSQMSTSHDDYQRMTSENRRRVSEFFSHSRLHYISTWGAECKAYVMQLQAQVSGTSRTSDL